MRIVHYSHCNLESAEASTAHVMEFAQRLSSRGHDLWVVAPEKGKYRFNTSCHMHYFPYLNIKGLRQITAIISGFLNLLFLNTLKGFDCIYVRRLSLDPLPGVFSRLTNLPLIVETNGQIEIHEYEVPFHFLWKPLWHPVLKIIEQVLFSAAYAVTADGERRLGNFKKRYHNWPEKFHLVRSGGIDLNKFRKINKIYARKKLGLPQNKKIMVWVGTIFAWSGLSTLIAAAEKICKELKDVYFLIIGDGPELNNFIRMAAQKNLSNRMQFTGYIATSKLYKWLSASDVALAPYSRLRLDREDFTSYKIFEYLACGLPVVCSYEKGKSNIRYIKEYNLGKTVPPDDVKEFIKAVKQVLNDPFYFSNEFVHKSRKILREINVTWDSIVDQIESLCLSSVK